VGRDVLHLFNNSFVIFLLPFFGNIEILKDVPITEREIARKRLQQYNYQFNEE